MYDIIVVGAGPAGLTAALYALRADKTVLVLEKSTFGGQITFSPQIENYPGYVKDDEGRIYNVIENQEIVNPVAMMQTLNNNKDWDKFVGSVWGELEVFENLTFKTSLSTDMAFWGERNWFPVSYLCYMVKTEKSRVEQTMNRGVKLLWENTLSYKRSIDKHNFAVLLGTSMERYDSKKVKGTALNLWAEDDHKAWIDFTNSASPGDQHSEGGATEHRMAIWCRILISKN